MMLFEITQLGGKFALSRFTFNPIGIILLAFIMERTTSEEEAVRIYEAATAQIKDDE